MHENTKIFRNLRNCAKSSISLNYLILIVVLDVNTVSNKVSTVTIFFNCASAKNIKNYNDMEVL